MNSREKEGKICFKYIKFVVDQDWEIITESYFQIQRAFSEEYMVIYKRSRINLWIFSRLHWKTIAWKKSPIRNCENPSSGLLRQFSTRCTQNEITKWEPRIRGLRGDHKII